MAAALTMADNDSTARTLVVADMDQTLFRPGALPVHQGFPYSFAP